MALALATLGCENPNGGGGSTTVTPPATQPPPPVTSDGIAQVVARAGSIVTVRVGDTATLDGSKSYTTSTEPLLFQWSFSTVPAGSSAQLQDTATATPSFTADAEGTYIAQLVVSAEGITSQRKLMQVVATEPPAAGTFHSGLSSDCTNCHSGDFATIPTKLQTHIAASNNCVACHSASPDGFISVGFVDHQEVFGNCSSCHDGDSAIGKSIFHTPTTAECDNCHNTSSFLDLDLTGGFDHTGVSTGCTSCHDGILATGKTPSPPHPDTASECIACHTTESFLDAFPDHTGPDVVDNRCDSCHGVSAAGQSIGHPQTYVDCAACHSIDTFSLGGVFNHRLADPAIQPCSSCHNDNNSINAPGKGSAVPAHIATSADCGFCHDTDNFSNAFVDHTDIVSDCAACHGVTASGKPANHMPTSEDCSVCHTPGSFTTGSYDHFGVINDCASCHNNVITIGKLASHIPTTLDCVTCHDTVDFRNATFDHIGIDTSDCAACHDGGISPGKPENHLPTTLDCSSCHDIGNFDSFAGITFNHAGIDPTNCASCHDTGIATPKKTNHIPAQEDCSVCHDSTVTFASSVFLFTQHQDIARGCEGCHVDQFFPVNPELIKAADHLPTDQDCYLCHTVAGFVPATFNHSGISGNCASCHDGSPDNVALGALGQTATPVHQNASGDCAICHNTVSFADAFVDHNSPEVTSARCDSCHNGINATGMDAKPDHVVTSQDCGTCHVPGGVFAPAVFNHTGITDNCASCHNGNDATGKDAKVDPPHLPTTQDCSACHVPTSFADARFDHQGITADCASCHDGITATGKSTSHVPTSGDCAECHQTTGFRPATFDHSGIVDNCASCHDTGFATGKSDTHLITSQDCGVCHNTAYFVPATFDHTGIVDNCESCHDGNTAIGKDAKVNPAHIATSLDCHACHTTATFTDGVWIHDDSSAGRCDECHNDSGGGAVFKPVWHLATTVQCDTCHVTTGWAPASFSHDPQGDYPGDHQVDPGCSQCHGNTVSNVIPYPSPQYAPFCAGCHARDFERKGDHIGGENGTVEQNKDCSNGGRGCHRVSDRNFD